MRAHKAQFKNLQEDLLRLGCFFKEIISAEKLIKSLPEEEYRHLKQSFDNHGIDRLIFKTVKKN